MYQNGGMNDLRQLSRFFVHVSMCLFIFLAVETASMRVLC